MILNLLRVEQLRVEDMMKRSFSELNSQKNQTTNKEKAKMLRDQLVPVSLTPSIFADGIWINIFISQELLPVPKSTGGEIELFYSSAKEIFKIREEVWTLLLSHPQALKTLTPGRVILVNINNRVYFKLLIKSMTILSILKAFIILVFIVSRKIIFLPLNLQKNLL